MNRTARAAAKFGAANAQHAKLGWDEVEHLTDAFAGRMQSATATRAEPCLYIERDLFVRQMVEGRPAFGILAEAAERRRTRRIARTFVFVKFVQRQFKLSDLEVAFLRRAAELHPPELCDACLELLDLKFFCGQRASQFTHQGMKRIDITRQGGEIETHARDSTAIEIERPLCLPS